MELEHQVDNGWVRAWQDEDGIGHVRWEPKPGHLDWPGHTYTPGDLVAP